MKKLLKITLIICILLSITGCSSSLGENNPIDSYTYEGSLVYVPVSYQHINDGSRRGLDIIQYVNLDTGVMYVYTEKYSNGYGTTWCELRTPDGMPVVYVHLDELRIKYNLGIKSQEIKEEPTETKNETQNELNESEYSNNETQNNNISHSNSESSSKETESIESNTISNIFTIPDGSYNYCPSGICDNNDAGMFYCSNVTPYTIADNICFSNISYEDNGNIKLANRYTVLTPTEGAWDSVHVCDPSVIKGKFTFRGTEYKYLMAYLGCNTSDNQKNQIGLAVSNELTSGWTKTGNPLIQHQFDSSQPDFQWGVGQPSLIALDNGNTAIFYTEGTYNLTCTKVQEWNFADLDNPVLVNEVTVTNNGTNDFISNADFAISDNYLYMVCDTHPFGGTILNCVPDTSKIYKIKWDGNIDALNYSTWEEVDTVSINSTGSQKNHNCGFSRDEKGNLVNKYVLYTEASEKSDFLSSLFTYRIKRIRFEI